MQYRRRFLVVSSLGWLLFSSNCRTESASLGTITRLSTSRPKLLCTLALVNRPRKRAPLGRTVSHQDWRKSPDVDLTRPSVYGI